MNPRADAYQYLYECRYAKVMKTKTFVDALVYLCRRPLDAAQDYILHYPRPDPTAGTEGDRVAGPLLLPLHPGPSTEQPTFASPQRLARRRTPSPPPTYASSQAAHAVLTRSQGTPSASSSQPGSQSGVHANTRFSQEVAQEGTRLSQEGTRLSQEGKATQ